METERIALRQRERDRLRVLHEVAHGHLTQVAAAGRMQLSDRQVRRLLQRIREQGDRAVIHGLRGRPSNRKLAAGFEQKILVRIGQRYADFGHTLATEHLAKEGFLVSRETQRKWMTQARFRRPLAEYTDKNSIFRMAGPAEIAEQLRGEAARSQFGRALSELGILWIAAQSPQAKGRASSGCLRPCRTAW